MLNLLDLREDNDLKEEYMSSILNVSQSQYSRLESGVSKLTHDKLIILASRFKTSTDYILGLTFETKPYFPNEEKTVLRLRELRKAKKLNGRDAAKIANLSQQQYSTVENNNCLISCDKLIKYANYYNTSVDYILGLTDIDKPYPKPPFEIK